MHIGAVVQGLIISALYPNPPLATAADPPDLCAGANNSTLAQCQRLYGGKQYSTLPDCIDAAELPISKCLEEAVVQSLGIPACDIGRFDSNYPARYLSCISRNGGRSYYDGCNWCTCTCTGLSACTRRACITPAPQL
ncbi:hypothetical protein DL89DRAFT_267956 [Linderina pennispora]|uniref:Pacifastin domain-containing protein n=1 Tax=Linderina pennispora TaxID=61395 RepID=A0A1Y1W6P3_9FUNG|nr:uncharacterized protein DL89DRAFT_267956 [Linderina pennispora]ORX68916.1 hypothetical protein DL89DRAFT_267956 [Linderina pennispora]